MDHDDSLLIIGSRYVDFGTEVCMSIQIANVEKYKFLKHKDL